MEPQRVDLSNDSSFKAARVVLWFSGACYLLLGLCVPLGMLAGATAPASGGPDRAVAIGFSFVLLAVGIACGIGNFAVARGLAQRKKWAWVCAVIIGAIYAPSGCMPLGLVVLWAMLRSGVKETYEAEAREASGGPTTF